MEFLLLGPLEARDADRDAIQAFFTRRRGARESRRAVG
jgi:hypothetical protein